MNAIGVVGLVPHQERPVAHDLARRAAGFLRDRGVEVRILDRDATAAGLAELGRPEPEFVNGLDIAVSLGGDGTMLRTVDLVYESGAAVLGVKVGQMGYLTEVEPDDLEASLERILRGDYTVTERMVLQVRVTSSGSAAGTWWALNEAVLEKAQVGKLARFAVTINGTFFTNYASDGVIVATPTGSTAYSFSARGPIVSPRLRCMLLTPVSPHMLFDRSLVLDADEELRFEVDQRPVVFVLDGRVLGELAAGDTVACTGGRLPARIVSFGPRDFHRILRAKFGLADR